MSLATIEIERIDVGQRLRGVSEAQVEALIASIGDVGLLNPITVYSCEVFRDGGYVDGFGVVAGAHRLEACKRLGLAEIEANVVSLSDLERQIAECDENLCATTLSKSERALFTKRRKDAYEALHPEAKAQVRQAHVKHGADDNLSPAFTQDTAAKTGVDVRTVQRDAERGSKINSEALGLIKNTKLDSGAYLDKIKAVPVGEQVAAVKRDLEAARTAKPSGLARRIVKIDEVLSDEEASDKQFATLVAAWNKAGESARQRFREEIVDAPVFDRSAA